MGGFNLSAYLATLTDGLYYDMTKLDRFFQENTGPTLADDVGEAIGLALDQRTWVNAFRLTVRTSGLLGVKVGGTTIIDVGPDLRGTDAVIRVSTDGTTIKLYANETEVYSVPSFTGSMPTAVPLRVGARNDNRTANVFFGGALKRLIVGRDHLALDSLQIRNSLLAA